MSLQRSDQRVTTATQTSDSHARTHARTKKYLAAGDPLSVVNAGRTYEGLASIGEVLNGGILRSSDRHEVTRTGERERIPHHVRSAVSEPDGGRCELCASHERAEHWELDHIVPWSAGGADTTTNLRVLCADYNQERSNYVGPEDTRPRMAATWWCDRCYWHQRQTVLEPNVTAYCAHCQMPGVTDVVP